MRTTVELDEDLVAILRERASTSGRSLAEVANSRLRSSLDGEATAREPRTYRLDPVSLGRPASGVDLDRALRLADDLEDSPADLAVDPDE